MVKQLGVPTLFCTLSAADTPWPDLFRLLNPEKNLTGMNEHQTNRTQLRLVNENPYVVANFFRIRAEYFIKHVLTLKFSIRDYWVRYEWQHRGFGHIHFILWLEDAADVSDLEKKYPRIAKKFAFIPTSSCPHGIQVWINYVHQYIYARGALEIYQRTAESRTILRC